MKNKILGLCFFTSIFLSAQNDYPYPSLSPMGNISQIIGNTTIKVAYERPAVRNRQIFGHLVPWDKVWRTGAGHCTKVHFDKSVLVSGQPLTAGTYSLFTIPNPREWVIIFNADTTLYGSGRYDSAKDVARFSVVSKKTDRFYEAMTIDIDFIPNNAQFYISWANTQVSFEISTSTDERIADYIKENLLTGKSKVSDSYAGAASYLLYQGKNYKLGLELADKALALDANNSWVYNTKIAIYEQLKLYPEALNCVGLAIENTEKRTYEEEKYRKADIDRLRAIYQRIEEKMK
ncbi:DUF2911 domain-containing protein [Flavobacteriaceae bacterium TP-CH-4]|uniref:DUF2911 domain-containing protein n=1 Tax=Pelagihabitans pacificus TaxID=2696054 RepID=A0A967AVC4_9FLAO|nr:DUF2911 domain-containing protein [Pelagihabitans pacificus]NHF58272.1 DUF2911 domain-containing protein [Pelagihabitans pacificus]